MTLTIADIANSSSQRDPSISKSGQLVASIQKLIKACPESGVDAILSGSGRRSVKDKSLHRGRSFATDKHLTASLHMNHLLYAKCSEIGPSERRWNPITNSLIESVFLKTGNTPLLINITR
jgi:hypothetical protein